MNKDLDKSINGLRERLFLSVDESADSNSALVVSLMSRSGQEGVTTITASLALSMSKVNIMRVLVISYDSSMQSAAIKLDAPVKVFRSFELADKKKSLSDYVQTSSKGQVDILTLDKAFPSGFHGDAYWDNQFADMKGRYQVILVDTGAFSSNLALRWSKFSDKNILVVDSSGTIEEELLRFKEELEADHFVLDAVVLNKRKYYVPKFLYKYIR